MVKRDAAGGNPNDKSLSAELPASRASKMLAHLHRRAAAHELSMLLAEEQRRGFDDREARFIGIVRTAKALRVAGRMSFERYVAIAGHMAEFLNEDRWASGAYDVELAPQIAILKAAEARAGLTAEEAFELGNGPEDYEKANAAYDRILDVRLSEVFVELGLNDIEQLWACDRGEYDRISDIGSLRRREAAEPRAPVEAMISIYECEADRCEEASAFYGACAMLGAAAEARLLARAMLDPETAERARAGITSSNRPRRPDPRGWTFDQLVSVAVNAGWIGTISDDEGEYQFVVSGLLDELRKLRNYVHAGRHALEKPLEALTLAEVADARAAYDSLVFSLEIGAIAAPMVAAVAGP